MEAHRYGLSAAALKYLAALFMLVDHIGMVFPTMLTELGLPTWADGLPGSSGGWPFPFSPTSWPRAAAAPASSTAISSGWERVPFSPRRPSPWPPASGAEVCSSPSSSAPEPSMAMSVCPKQSTAQPCRPIPLFAACALALLLNVDYGFPAVLLIFALYLCGDNRRRKLLCLGAGLALLYLLYQPLIGLLSLPLFRPDWMAGYLLHALPVFALYALCAEASLLLLAWYRGQLGVQSKWFFYVFYPAHLLGLWALGLALN